MAIGLKVPKLRLTMNNFGNWATFIESNAMHGLSPDNPWIIHGSKCNPYDSQPVHSDQWNILRIIARTVMDNKHAENNPS